MTYISLKIIASISMLIDHIGYVFPNGNIYFNTIGRIAFPLYILTFCEGTVHSSHPRKRILSIFIMALISEPFFDYVITGTWINFSRQNVLFLFALASLCIYYIENKSSVLDKLPTIIVSSFVSSLLCFDYGSCGMAAIYICYHFVEKTDAFNTDNKLLINLAWLPIVINYIPLFIETPHLLLLLAGYAAVPVFIFMYNGEKGHIPKAGKNFLFVFYPLHLIILSLIEMFNT